MFSILRPKTGVLSLYQLDSSEEQEGGKIPDNVMQELYQYISTLPEKKKPKRG